MRACACLCVSGRYAKPEFFSKLKESHGIDLESCTYYRDETHYYVMAASKESLLETGVLKANHAEIHHLLQRGNVDAAAMVNNNDY